VKEGEAAIESKKGNTITKSAMPNDPAVHVTRPGNDVVKNASELEVEEPKASGTANDGEKAGATDAEKPVDDDKDMDDAEEKPEDTGEAQAGDKRDHTETEKNGNGTKDADVHAEEPAEAADKAEEKEGDEPPAKKQKQSQDAATEEKNGDAVKKGRGRPKKSESNGTGTKGSAKKKEPKKAATETGEPRRSGRNSSVSK
jgi:hypothetical protein